MPSEEDLMQISHRALILFRKRSEADRRSLAPWAREQFYRLGIEPAGVAKAEQNLDNDDQMIADLIDYNMMLPDWMRARMISVEDVLESETFEDLIDKLTPAYSDR